MTRLGQHFLKNKTVIRKIAEALELKEGDLVVEIGPGHGELTWELVKYPVEVIAVEKDRFLARELEKQGLKMKIIEGDILKILPELSAKLKTIRQLADYKLVGNIPYYLTGYLLRTISELNNKPALTVFTIQKEVAERICAQPPRMNLLAASIQIWARPEIIANIPAEDFDPPPKVDSAVIKLEVIPRQAQDENYFSLIKILFKQPRKTILNNLADNLGFEKEEIKEKLKKLGISGEERPQNLGIETIKKLAKVFH